MSESLKPDLPEIWLEPACADDSYEGRTWCGHDCWNGKCEDCGSPSVRYVRADLIDRQPASDTPDPRDEVIRELRDALDRLLACPAIADENHSDPAWGDNETADAILFARRARAALSKGEGDT